MHVFPRPNKTLKAVRDVMFKPCLVSAALCPATDKISSNQSERPPDLWSRLNSILFFITHLVCLSCISFVRRLQNKCMFLQKLNCPKQHVQFTFIQSYCAFLGFTFRRGRRATFLVAFLPNCRISDE